MVMDRKERRECLEDLPGQGRTVEGEEEVVKVGNWKLGVLQSRSG